MELNRIDYINFLIEQNNYKTYLEIGIEEGYCFERIVCESKDACDPYPYGEYAESICNYKMESDKMFSSVPKDKKWDIIFIDGLHVEEQVIRDIVNSFKHLNKGGKIMVHDCLPEEYSHQLDSVNDNISASEMWNGSTWKAIPKLKELGIRYYVIDGDQGCAIIDYFDGYEDLEFYEKTSLTWDDFVERRNELMNVISVEEFLHREWKKHQICFVTPAYRPFNLGAIGIAIKRLIDENPDFGFFWVICVDRYNSFGNMTKEYAEFFKMGIPFLGYLSGKPNQKNYGGDLINEPLARMFDEEYQFYKILDPWLYILDDDNLPSERILDAIRRADAEGGKRIVWMRYLNSLGRIYTPYRFNAFEYDTDRYPKWNPDPSAILIKSSLFFECGGFKGGVDYDFTSIREIVQEHFDETLMMTDLPNGDSSRCVSYDAYHNAIPFTDSILLVKSKIPKGECYGHVFIGTKDEKKLDITTLESGHVSNSIALNVFKKETLEKIYNLIIEEYKDLHILNDEKKEHDINRFNKK